jgi:hypothetical protein
MLHRHAAAEGAMLVILGYQKCKLWVYATRESN